jgi:hypothetical protein
MICVSLIGAGRIGQLHANNLLANPSRLDVTIHDGLLSLIMASAAHESATKHELVSLTNC